MLRVEDKFQTFGDRVDIKLDSLRKRETSLENDVLERVASVETDISSRVSRLEDRLASVILSKSQEPEPDESQAIATIKADLTEVTRSVEMLNRSHTDLQEYRQGTPVDGKLTCQNFKPGRSRIPKQSVRGIKHKEGNQRAQNLTKHFKRVCCKLPRRQTEGDGTGD